MNFDRMLEKLVWNIEAAKRATSGWDEDILWSNAYGILEAMLERWPERRGQIEAVAGQ